MTDVISVSPPLSAASMAAVRREAIFACCKWDPQAEDISVLSNFVLIITPECWRHLSTAAAALYQETLQAEAEISADAKLIKMLCLPPPLEATLLAECKSAIGTAPDQPRVMRFDFHATESGWQISEVNSDVPGGYIEAAGFTAIMARHYPGCAPTAHPVSALIAALQGRQLTTRGIGLVHATAYVDDRQVMIYLQREFARAGITSHLLSPADITWSADGTASRETGPLSALLRFFPAEWLPNLSGNQWRCFFQNTATPQINPGRAVLSQSKRFPLTWPYLQSPLPRWRELLPETISWRDNLGPDWATKPSFGRVGDGIGLHGTTTPKEWSDITKAIARKPTAWVAQRRFNALPCLTHQGPAYPCLGVYVIDGQAAGIYGRIAPRPLIDHQAQDIAVLLSSPRDLAFHPRSSS